MISHVLVKPCKNWGQELICFHSDQNADEVIQCQVDCKWFEQCQPVIQPALEHQQAQCAYHWKVSLHIDPPLMLLLSRDMSQWQAKFSILSFQRGTNSYALKLTINVPSV